MRLRCGADSFLSWESLVRTSLGMMKHEHGINRLHNNFSEMIWDEKTKRLSPPPRRDKRRRSRAPSRFRDFRTLGRFECRRFCGRGAIQSQYALALGAFALQLRPALVIARYARLP